MNVLPRSLHLLLATACAMTLVGQDACAVEYRFTAEPIYAPDAAREIYKPLLDYLYAHASQPQFQTRFQWREGSIAFWDNRATWHLAINDYQGERRLMHRITLDGVPLV